jgi:hypothetical protein
VLCPDISNPGKDPPSTYWRWSLVCPTLESMSNWTMTPQSSSPWSHHSRLCLHHQGQENNYLYHEHGSSKLFQSTGNYLPIGPLKTLNLFDFFILFLIT